MITVTPSFPNLRCKMVLRSSRDKRCVVIANRKCTLYERNNLSVPLQYQHIKKCPHISVVCWHHLNVYPYTLIHILKICLYKGENFNFQCSVCALFEWTDLCVDSLVVAVHLNAPSLRVWVQCQMCTFVFTVRIWCNSSILLDCLCSFDSYRSLIFKWLDFVAITSRH